RSMLFVGKYGMRKRAIIVLFDFEIASDLKAIDEDPASPGGRAVAGPEIGILKSRFQMLVEGTSGFGVTRLAGERHEGAVKAVGDAMSKNHLRRVIQCQAIERHMAERTGENV